ncbi:maleylpyruvate isomerase N-terminal domain-containing protein [Actinoplanes sp. TFC3]|uniref:maleylpyruvate isomerase N-terminal domain-containing protein n=1 Tax=Actinoplanes sp. TFC3 TaxID=1710355 RepID=UPI00082C8371|nr:maleylpyruvate isomerase N-terminal domain-containing protein [Actinoplanes sp. TFC3]
MDFRWAYKSAVTVFTDLVFRIPDERWAGPGLGEWSLRDLVGHTVSSALHQVPGVLASPAPTVTLESPEAYWGLTRTVPPEIYAAATAASTQDARKAGESLGDEPARAVAEFARKATQALSAAGDSDVVATAGGGMRVRDWIATRTFELVVHGLDVAGAAGVPVEFAAEVLTDTTLQAARVADPTLLLRALTGRGQLPANYSVVDKP